MITKEKKSGNQANPTNQGSDNMNQGWEIKKLGEVLALKYGKPLPKNKRVIAGKYPVYGANGIKSRSNDFYYDKETIVVGRKGSAGEINLTEKKFWPLDVTYFATFDRAKFDLFFLFHLLSSLELPKLAKGVKPGINRNEVYELEVSIPPLSEQQRIVSILDECFAAIDKAKANAEQNLKNAKELFESYLQEVFEKRSLNHDSNDLLDSPDSKNQAHHGNQRNQGSDKGEGWEEKIIKEVCELKSGTTISKNLERTEGDVLYVKVGDMTLPENEVEIKISSRFVNSNEIKANQIIPNGAIIFPKRGGAIATNKKRKIIKPTIVDLNTMAIIPGSKIDSDYFFHWFQIIDLNSISNGTSIPQINNYSFDEVKILFPNSKTEQQNIVRQLDALRAETQKLEAIYQQKLLNLEELKKSVLQKAFTGELAKRQAGLKTSASAVPVKYEINDNLSQAAEPTNER
ncbi:type I restriction enzyme, S subunit [Tangfeifania diversioriginum]|uniref:Type I restriction enzyme, S subunit n=1 Tax=Tangfeifania diversioriginum TaxID=1168035 RepID=A0A1M6G9U0_9BACT|nr:restriction endonuclease subunit S [Tangfeifania diversioriginum]SHJ06644.1 type I restriction enzyme, S subunit [Tangfeifania diversioriginum]